MAHEGASHSLLEQHIKESWRNAQIEPREHQWKTCAKIIEDINSPPAGSNPGKNYLIQHAAGSGKSLTIACLVVQLYNLKVQFI